MLIIITKDKKYLLLSFIILTFVSEQKFQFFMDFRLRVFKSVATQLSFTKAAKELSISQPAITKHIQELEGLYNVQLFERAGGKIKLTLNGKILLNYANEILSKYEMLSYKMELLSHKFKGGLKIGASGTIAETIMPSLLADLTCWFPDFSVSLVVKTSNEIEKALIEKQIDIGLIESYDHLPELVYSKLAEDEYVLVTSTESNSSGSISLQEFAKKQLVLPQLDYELMNVIKTELNSHGIILGNIKGAIYLDSIRSIIKFVKSVPNKYAIIPLSSVAKELKNNELKLIRIEGMKMERKLEFVTLHGKKNSINEQFISFVSKWYIKN